MKTFSLTKRVGGPDQADDECDIEYRAVDEKYTIASDVPDWLASIICAAPDLMRERDEAQAACVAAHAAVQRVMAIIASVPDCKGGCVQAARGLLYDYATLIGPSNPGQALLDRLKKAEDERDEARESNRNNVAAADMQITDLWGEHDAACEACAAAEDELAKLREIVARLRDDELPNRVVFENDNRHGVLTYPTQIDAYRAAVLDEKEHER